MEYKICNVCGKRFLNDSENFYKAISNKDGLSKRCKKCTLQIKKRYREKNRRKILMQRAEYRKNNKDKVIESGLKYRKNNRLKLRESAKKYYHTDRGKILSLMNWHKRKSKLNRLKADFTIGQWIACKQYFNNSCAYCGLKTDALEQDHFVPRSMGGEYTVTNIVPACKSCNSGKRNKNFIQWYKKQSFYSADREKAIINYLESKKDSTILQNG